VRAAGLPRFRGEVFSIGPGANSQVKNSGARGVVLV
jgi:hypothetical protein